MTLIENQMQTLMDKHTILHTIPKEAEGTYYSLSFPVPGGLERVNVSYSYERLSRGNGKQPRRWNVVDLGLMDAHERFLGWSGSSRSSVYTGPYASTNGYLMTEITPGQWHIIVGAYRIPPGGLEVRYVIEYTPKTSRWLAGDLHVHSDASDGQHDTSTLAKKAKKAGLDFIAVSNHNNFSENLRLPSVPGLTLIPAVEWTHYRGHMNFFGISSPFDNSFVANSEEEMLAIAAYAKERGALVSVNHPRCNLCPYLWNSHSVFDLVEVWNGPMRKVNTDAIEWWHRMLAAGRRLPAVGGSDFHRDRRPVRFARPVTKVYAGSPAAADILGAITRGHCYVTSSTRGVTLDLRCGKRGNFANTAVMMGDVTPWSEGLELSINAQHMPPGVRLKLVTSEGLASLWKSFRDGELNARIPVPASWRFAYLIAFTRVFGRQFVRAVTNPVYFEK